MASNQRIQKWLLLLGTFAAGTFAGYRYHIYDIRPALANPSNKVYFNILPGKDVHAAPNAGDVLEWYKDGSQSGIYIHFIGDSPCDPTGGGGSTCTITAAAAANKGQYMYFCSDTADPADPGQKILCHDPGIDPGSGGDGKLELPGKNNVVYAAQAVQRPKSPEPVAPKTASQIRPTDLIVLCKNNTVQVLNTSTTPPNTETPIVPIGGLVQWNSTLSPTIRITSGKCEGSTGGNPPYCTVQSIGDISYTINVPKDKCANPGPAPFHISARNLLKGCEF